MTGLSKRTLAYMRKILEPYNIRPIGALLFIDPVYPDNAVTYKVSLTSTQIGITKSGGIPFLIRYVNKTTREVASELNNSPYPIEVRAIADISFLKETELLVSGTDIPESFPLIDRGNVNGSVIVRAKRWSVNFEKLSYISVKPVYDEDGNKPWWPLVGNGSFMHKENGVTYHFGVPEYKNQTWSHTYGFPFMDVDGETVNQETSTKIRLDRSPLLYKNNNIVFTSADGDQIFPSSIIKTVDTMNGIVYLNENASIPPDALVYYTYLERNLVYKDININGHFVQNPFMLNKYIVLYVLPINSNSGINRQRGVYHSVGDSIPDAINNIESTFVLEPISIIGAYYVRQHSDLENANMVDSRSFGGGLREDNVGELAAQKFLQSQFFNDIGRVEGIAYPGAGAIVVDIPEYLKETMSVADIKKRARRFVAAGVYPIYNITDTNPTKSIHNTDISQIEHDVNILSSSLTVETRNLIPFSTNLANGFTTSSSTNWVYGCVNSYPAPYFNDGLQREFDSTIANPDGSGPSAKMVLRTIPDNILTQPGVIGGYSCMRQNMDGAIIGGQPIYLNGNGTSTHPTGHIDTVQTYSIHVRQGTALRFFIMFHDREEQLYNPAGDEHGALFEWQLGVPTVIELDDLDPALVGVTDVGSGWYRISITYYGGTFYTGDDTRYFEFPTNLGHVMNCFFYPVFYGFNDNENDVKTHYGEYTYVWGPQLERTALTDYQPTDGYTPRRGPTNDVAWWIPSTRELPDSIYSGYTADDIEAGPESRGDGMMVLKPGKKYTQKYIKGPPTAWFSWEEKSRDTEWTKKTIRDDRLAPNRSFIGGKLEIDSEFGYKFVRNLTGFVGYRIQNDEDFYPRVVEEIADILEDTRAISETGNWFVPLKDQSNVFSTALTDRNYVSAGVDPLFEAPLYYYDVHVQKGLYRDDKLILDHVRFFNDSLENGWPRRFDGTGFLAHEDINYNAIKDIETYSRFTTARMNYISSLQTGEYSAHQDYYAAVGQSGVWHVASGVDSLTHNYGTKFGVFDHARPIYYNTLSGSIVPFVTGGGLSDVNTMINNQYLGSEYVRAFAALYATQIGPTLKTYSGGAGGLPFAHPYQFSPVHIAISGIGHLTKQFDSFFDDPTFSGEALTVTWLSSFNRVSQLASRYIKNVVDSFDYIYYGNDEWAGYPLVGEPKRAPLRGQDPEFLQDNDFFNNPRNNVWPDNIPRNLERSLKETRDRTIINLNKVRDFVISETQRGGVMEPGYIDLVHTYLWLPKHVALGEDLFTGRSDLVDSHTQVFEEAMSAILRSSFSEDGIFIEGGYYNHEIAPFAENSVPSKIFEVAADAISYYDTVNNEPMKEKWRAIAQGMFYSCTGLYKQVGGYPTSPYFDENNSVGDFGSSVARGYTALLGQKDSAFNTLETLSLTGGGRSTY
jgi:hypothetical protein